MAKVHVGGRDSSKMTFSAQTMWGTGCPAEVMLYVAQMGLGLAAALEQSGRIGKARKDNKLAQSWGSCRWRRNVAELFQGIQTLLLLDYPSLLKQEKHQCLRLRDWKRQDIQKVLIAKRCVYA